MVLLIPRFVLDESLPVYIALRPPYKDEARLKSYLTRLNISLEVLAYGFQPRPSGGQDGSKESSPSRNEDTLWAGNVDSLEDPIIIIQEDGDQTSGHHILVIWRKIIPLCRILNSPGLDHGLLMAVQVGLGCDFNHP